MSILAVSGDVGGARAVKSVLEVLAKRNEKFFLIDYGVLAQESPKDWSRIKPLTRFAWEDFGVLLFSTSVKDVFPLSVARLARKQGVFVACLLDNWMSYRERLEIDGEETFWPDLYLVMDELALAGALEAGIPKDILRVVGQPALSSLKSELDEYQPTKKNKKVLVFISEPAEKDQGTGRGYNEKTVLKEFCQRLVPFKDIYEVIVVPHPREDEKEVTQNWEKFRGPLEGRVQKFKSGREGIFLADGVVGMVSILLYEAWLIGKPVLSLQPGLKKKDLDVMKVRNGIHCVNETKDWESQLKAWLGEVNKQSKNQIRSEFQFHLEAGERIADFILKARVA